MFKGTEKGSEEFQYRVNESSIWSPVAVITFTLVAFTL